MPPANLNKLLSGLRRRRLRPAEVAAPAAETVVVLGFAAKGVHIIVEVRIELRNDFSFNRLWKRIERERCLRLAAVSFAVWTWTFIERLDARPVTRFCDFIVVGKAEKERLSGVLSDQRVLRVIKRLHVVLVAVAVQNRHPFKPMAQERATDLDHHRT